MKKNKKPLSFKLYFLILGLFIFSFFIMIKGANLQSPSITLTGCFILLGTAIVAILIADNRTKLF